MLTEEERRRLGRLLGRPIVPETDFTRMRDRLDSSLKLWVSRGKQKDDLLEPGLHLAEGEKLLKDADCLLDLDVGAPFAQLSEATWQLPQENVQKSHASALVLCPKDPNTPRQRLGSRHRPTIAEQLPGETAAYPAESIALPLSGSCPRSSVNKGLRAITVDHGVILILFLVFVLF
jgi:hypothetical protein